MEALGLTARDVYLVHDELTGQTWRWGQHAFVRLTHDDPAHILTLVRYGSRTTSPGSRPADRPPLMTGHLIPGRRPGAEVPIRCALVRRQGSPGRAGSLTPLPWLTEVSSSSARRRAGRPVRDRRGGLPAQDEDPAADAVPATSADRPSSSRGPARGRTSTTSCYGAPQRRPAPRRDRPAHRPDLGPVIAYDAAQDPEACRVIWAPLLAGRRMCATPRRGGLPPPRRPGLDAELEPPALHRSAEQHLGDVRRRRHDQALPPARAGPQPRHRGARRAQRGRGRRRRPAVSAGPRAPGQPAARRWTADLAMVVEKLADAVDGWGWRSTS